VKVIAPKLVIIFLLTTLVSCNSVKSTPTPNPQDVAKVAIAIAETGIAMTQTAIPTTIFTPTTAPTAIPPEPTRIPFSSYEDKIKYAMATAPEIYNHLPHINKETLYGEYSGCVTTYDFHNFVTYTVSLPIETVNAAFLKYFSTENWEFTEAISELVGSNNNIPRTTYEVYRITSKNVPAFERLKVILTDESLGRGKDHVYIRVELNHLETKKNFAHLADSYFYCPDPSWLWMSLHKNP
jgi:hypothetical protein